MPTGHKAEKEHKRCIVATGVISGKPTAVIAREAGCGARYVQRLAQEQPTRLLIAELMRPYLPQLARCLALAVNAIERALSAQKDSLEPYEWDSANYGTSFTYRGNVTQANTPGKTINTSYDATGTVVSQDDNNGHSVSVTTSSLTNFTLPDALTPNGTTTLQTQATYTSPNFMPASVAGPNQTLYNPSTQTGTAPYTAYDSYGRVSYTLAPSQAVGQAGAQTNYTYNYTLPASITATTQGSSASHWSKTVVDGFGRAASVQSGYGSTTLSQVDALYAPCGCSPLGKMYQQSQPYLPPNSSPPRTTYTYDALGRTTKVLLADGASFTTYTYQGNVTTVTDPAGNWKQYTGDAFGNLVAVLEPDPANAPGGTLLTSYTYDQLNHLTQVQMPRNTVNGVKTQTRTFAYDSVTQRLNSATNPENGTVKYTYNTDGTLASKQDANGVIFEHYLYDTYGRLTGIPERQQTFNYDTCSGNTTGCVNAPGQLMQAIFAASVGSANQWSFQYNYGYTPAGRVSNKTLVVQSANHFARGGAQAAGSIPVSYTYDSQGALATTAYQVQGLPSNVFTYTMDAMERPTGMTDSLNSIWASSAVYNAANQMTSVTLLNGFNTETRGYNSLLQLTSVTQKRQGASVMDMHYNFSTNANNGQITSSTDNITGETVTYTYDALKRLLEADGLNWKENYVYDGFGNLLQMNPTPTGGSLPTLNLSIAVDQNLVPTNRIAGMSYDQYGNLNSGLVGDILSYDGANRLITASNGSQSNSYVYDSSNLRMYSRDASSGAETLYFFAADGTKLATYGLAIGGTVGNYTVQFTFQSNNVYFAGRLLQAQNNWVATDRLGSVRSGGPANLGYQAQYPYGKEYTTTANDREKYATYTRDGLTGLDYAVNRYYSSQWGRFLSPDLYGGSGYLTNPGTLNRYTYGTGDPANVNDPSGLCADVSAGVTQNPDQASGENVMLYAEKNSAVSAFPYANQGFAGGLTDVNSQSNGTWSDATTTFNSSFYFTEEVSKSGTVSLFLFSGSAQAANADAANLASQGELSNIDYVVYVSPGFGFGQDGNILRGTKGTYWISNPSSAYDLNANNGKGTQQLLSGVTYLQTTCDHDFTCTMTNPIIDPKTGKNFNKNNSFFSSVSGGPCPITSTFVPEGYVSPLRGGGGSPPIGRPVGDPFGWACLVLFGPNGCPTLISE